MQSKYWKSNFFDQWILFYFIFFYFFVHQTENGHCTSILSFVSWVTDKLAVQVNDTLVAMGFKYVANRCMVSFRL